MTNREQNDIEKINKMKKQDSLVCEIVIPTNSKDDVMSVIYGNGGTFEIARMAQSLEDIIKNLKQNFPQIIPLINVLHQCSGMEESYKKIEKIERKEK